MKPDKISMKITEEQFNRDLADKLKESGHKKVALSDFYYCNYIASFGNEDNTVLTNLISPIGYKILDYNPELFLAIINMSKLKEGRVGEYVKYIEESNNKFTKNKLYKLQNNLNCERAIEKDDTERPNGFNHITNRNFEYFTKPTFEEILAHFGIYSSSFKITSEIMAEKLKKIQELVQ